MKSQGPAINPTGTKSPCRQQWALWGLSEDSSSIVGCSSSLLQLCQHLLFQHSASTLTRRRAHNCLAYRKMFKQIYLLLTEAEIDSGFFFPTSWLLYSRLNDYLEKAWIEKWKQIGRRLSLHFSQISSRSGTQEFLLCSFWRVGLILRPSS